jgi:imidazolonepropionase-like amidohydrolase
MMNRFAMTFPVRLACCLIALAGAPVGARSAEAWLLSGATVHTVSGETLSPGQVLVRDGKIAEVGKTVQGGDATVVDLSGQHLYPGLIALDTVLGLTEISGVRSTQDTTESGDYTADVESWIAANPDSELIPVTRANGIAYFQPVPQGATVSGQSGLVAVDGWTTEQRTLRKPVALHLYWPGMQLSFGERAERRGEKGKAKSLDEQTKERRAKLRAAADFFDDARAYLKAKEAAASGKTPAPAVVPAWEAMLPYLRAELPIMVHADDIRQIKAAVEWASSNQFKMILTGGRDAWMAADLLAAKKVPVVYAHIFTLPARDSDPYDVYFRAPALLHKAGVQVTFSQGATSFDAALTKNLPYCAAQAVAFGLAEEEALKGITLYPAQLMGVGDRLGTIQPGKEATLFAADRNILDLRATVKHLWLAGKEVSLENRHTRLFEKYKNRPKP